jgi:tRNA-Thr(GGU) m(6)t(6)A37 methyltransferase TsaA
VLDVTYHSIGTIHSPFTDLRDMPVQPAGEASAPGVVEILPEYADGLRDLEGFSHVILIYHLHGVRRVDLTVTPFLASGPKGIFATRAPTRPNPIGLSVVQLVRIEGNVLHIAAIDVLDGTPLLDLKPYVEEFDHPQGAVAGWLEAARGGVRRTRSDDRFA